MPPLATVLNADIHYERVRVNGETGTETFAIYYIPAAQLPALGCAYTAIRTIYVRNNLSARVTRHVRLHEIAHAHAALSKRGSARTRCGRELQAHFRAAPRDPFGFMATAAVVIARLLKRCLTGAARSAATYPHERLLMPYGHEEPR